MAAREWDAEILNLKDGGGSFLTDSGQSAIHKLKFSYNGIFHLKLAQTSHRDVIVYKFPSKCLKSLTFAPLIQRGN